MPVHEGYTTWCDACEYDILAPPNEPPNGRIDRLRWRLGARLGDQLLTEMLNQPVPSPRLTLDTLLAYAIAGFVNLIPVVLLVAAVIFAISLYADITGGASPMGVSCFSGPILALLLGAVWAMRPRLGKQPEDILPPAEAPKLYALVHAIADALHTKRPHDISILSHFNASYSRYGWRQRVHISLGLPFVTSVVPQELVALLSHELAHGVNNDVNRGWFMHTAISTSFTLYEILLPTWGAGLVSLVQTIITFPFAILFRLIAEGLVLLTFRASQRAEFYADLLGAQISGSAAAIRLLRKSELADKFMSIAETTWARIKIFKNESVYDKFQQHVRGMPEREMERLARVQARTHSSLDNTHPPTDHRVRFIAAQPALPPRVTLTDEDFAAILAELKPHEKRMQDKLMGHT